MTDTEESDYKKGCEKILVRKYPPVPSFIVINKLIWLRTKKAGLSLSRNICKIQPSAVFKDPVE